jgi:hypothetical protein
MTQKKIQVLHRPQRILILINQLAQQISLQILNLKICRKRIET